MSDCICFGLPSWLDNRIRRKVTSRRKHDSVLVAVVGAAVMGDADIEARVVEYENLLVRGQIPAPALLSVIQAVELIYEARGVLCLNGIVPTRNVPLPPFLLAPSLHFLRVSTPSLHSVCFNVRLLAK